jgi:4-amino-4-deoxy-L-arabinose transferase-like glycosyltransferase
VLAILSAVLAIGATALFIGLEVSALHAGQRDYDEGVYWQSLRALSKGHPLFVPVVASQPPVFYYGLLPFFLLFGKSIAAARIGILVYGLIALLAIYLVGRLLAGPIAGAIAVVLLATDPLFLRQGATLQAEAPALAFGIASVALALLAARVRSRPAGWPINPAVLLAGASGLLFALGVGSKLSGLVVAVPIVLVVVLGAPGFRVALAGAFVAGAAAATVAILIPIASHWPAAYGQLITLHLAAGAHSLRGFAYNWQLILYRPERPLEILALFLAAVALLRRDRAVVTPVVWGIATFSATLVYEPLFLHHVVFLIPCLALIAGVGVRALSQVQVPALPRVRVPGLAFSALAVSAVVAAGAFQVGDRQANQALRIAAEHNATVASVIRSETQAGAYVISDNQYAVAMANRDVPPSLVDTSGVQIVTNAMTADALERAAHRYRVAVIVFDSGRLKQVQGLLPWLRLHYPDKDTIGATTLFEISP